MSIKANGLSTLALKIGKVNSYFQTLRSNSNDKFNLIFSFDSDKHKSYYAYTYWLRDIIFKAGKLDAELPMSEMRELLIYAGYEPYKYFEARFSMMIHIYYDDDEIMGFRIDVIRKIVAIVERGIELGYLEDTYIPEMFKKDK